jgi:hypothetical protein
MNKMNPCFLIFVTLLIASSPVASLRALEEEASLTKEEESSPLMMFGQHELQNEKKTDSNSGQGEENNSKIKNDRQLTLSGAIFNEKDQQQNQTTDMELTQDPTVNLASSTAMSATEEDPPSQSQSSTGYSDGHTIAIGSPNNKVSKFPDAAHFAYERFLSTNIDTQKYDHEIENAIQNNHPLLDHLRNAKTLLEEAKNYQKYFLDKINQNNSSAYTMFYLTRSDAVQKNIQHLLKSAELIKFNVDTMNSYPLNNSEDRNYENRKKLHQYAVTSSHCAANYGRIYEGILHGAKLTAEGLNQARFFRLNSLVNRLKYERLLPLITREFININGPRGPLMMSMVSGMDLPLYDAIDNLENALKECDPVIQSLLEEAADRYIQMAREYKTQLNDCKNNPGPNNATNEEQRQFEEQFSQAKEQFMTEITNRRNTLNYNLKSSILKQQLLIEKSKNSDHEFQQKCDQIVEQCDQAIACSDIREKLNLYKEAKSAKEKLFDSSSCTIS